MICRARVLSLAFVAILIMASPVRAVPPEDGPAFMTDSHGASGVAYTFMELSKVDPKYDKYWKGALDWLLHVAERDQQGRMTWYFSTSAPAGHPNRHINTPGVCHIIRTFFEGYESSKDERYKQAGIAGARMLVEQYAQKKKTPLGTAYGWSHTPRAKGLGFLAGHSHGLGNMMDTILAAHKVEPRDEYLQALKGILINLKLRSKKMESKDGELVLAWPAVRNKQVCETGYCYGQAGIILPLLKLSQELPELKLSDGTTPLLLANANLRYLMSVAQKDGQGYVWHYMRHQKITHNIGYGSGTGGIGWAFLKGAQVNAKENPELAKQCKEYARGAAIYALQRIEKYEGKTLTYAGGDGGFGLCGGSGGAVHFLLQCIEALGDEHPDHVEKLNRAIKAMASIVEASCIELENGTMACPDRPGKQLNLALDYGQTGVCVALAYSGLYLNDKELTSSAIKVADFIVSKAVPEGGGYKFAQYYPIPE